MMTLPQAAEEEESEDFRRDVDDEDMTTKSTYLSWIQTFSMIFVLSGEKAARSCVGAHQEGKVPVGLGLGEWQAPC